MQVLLEQGALQSFEKVSSRGRDRGSTDTGKTAGDLLRSAGELFRHRDISASRYFISGRLWAQLLASEVNAA